MGAKVQKNIYIENIPPFTFSSLLLFYPFLLFYLFTLLPFYPFFVTLSQHQCNAAATSFIDLCIVKRTITIKR